MFGQCLFINVEFASFHVFKQFSFFSPLCLFLLPCPNACNRPMSVQHVLSELAAASREAIVTPINCMHHCSCGSNPAFLSQFRPLVMSHLPFPSRNSQAEGSYVRNTTFNSFPCEARMSSSLNITRVQTSENHSGGGVSLDSCTRARSDS